MNCNDCNRNVKAFVTYGDFTKRCEQCSCKFDFINWKQRYLKNNAEHTCDNCNETFIGQYECPHCCEHDIDPDEGYHCLSCGTDCSEDVISSAYDAIKDYMKYG